MIEYNVKCEVPLTRGGCCGRMIHADSVVFGCTCPKGHKGRHFATGGGDIAYVAWDNEKDEAAAAMIAAMGVRS